MNNSLPLVSIVVPVYNVAPYLERCIESLRRQSYKKLDIWLIDDGSTDSSGELCDLYTEKDGRIHVIHQKNGGLSEARNTGIDQCAGQFLCFVDSDDAVADTFIETLLYAIQKSQADISICGFQEFCEHIPMKNADEEGVNSYIVLSREKALENLLYQRMYTTAACGKMFCIELWKEIRFPKGKLFEDLAVIYQVFDRCKNVAVTSGRLYYYYQRSGSIMRTFSREGALDRIQHSRRIEAFIGEKYPALKAAAKSRSLASAVLTLKKIPLRKENEDLLNIVRSVIRDTRRTVMRDRRARCANRLAAALSYLGLPFLKISIQAYDRIVHVTAGSQKES